MALTYSASRFLITCLLIYTLLLKDCLDIFVWISIKLKKRIMWFLQSFCVNTSFQTALLNDAQEDVSLITFLSNDKRPRTSDSLNSYKTPMKQTQRNEHLKLNSGEQYMCQKCQLVNEALINYKNWIMVSKGTPIINIFKTSVGTQTAETENLYTEHRAFESPILHNQLVSVFEKREQNSVDALNTFVESSAIEKPITPKNTFQLVRSSNSSERKLDLKMEIEKAESPEISAKNNIETFPEETFVDISLESSENSAMLLESPLCRLNLESINNLQLTFSEDEVVSRLSTEKQSSFKKSWNKLKLKFGANNSFLEMKKENSGLFTISEQCSKEGSVSFPQREKIRNIEVNGDGAQMIGCCGNIFQKLKSKFHQKVDENLVVYKRF